MLRYLRFSRARLGCMLASLFLGAVLLAPAPARSSEEAPLWGNLKPGPHAVGFMAVEEYDYARSFQPKRDYFGTILPGERARRIQICIWYPAKKPVTEVPVVFSEYAFSPPEDIEFYEFLSAIQNREIRFLYQILDNNETAILEVLGTGMKAVKGADAADGVFPLLVYHSDFNRGIAENAVMCEYLASHGFVVAVTHSFGPAAIRSELGPAGLETMARDMEFIVSAVRGLGFVDRSRVGAFGYRAGALAALLLQMRSYDVDALVGLEPVADETGRVEMVMGNPYYDISRVTVPVLQVHSAAEETREETMVGLFEYAPRHALDFGGASRGDFTTYGLLRAISGTPETSPPSAGGQVYEAVCAYVMRFFDAHLNGTEESLRFLAQSPSDSGMDELGVTMVRMEARDRPPSQDEFVAILGEGRIDTAVDLYDKFRAADPELVLFPEGVMNITGYGLLQRGMVSEAVAVFRMNADTYPQSANCWDSLAEAYMAAGENDHALECVQKVIETLPNDTNISDDLRAALENNVQQYMERLKGE